MKYLKDLNNMGNIVINKEIERDLLTLILINTVSRFESHAFYYIKEGRLEPRVYGCKRVGVKLSSYFL